jgi:hypothetical protein
MKNIWKANFVVPLMKLIFFEYYILISGHQKAIIQRDERNF